MVGGGESSKLGAKIAFARTRIILHINSSKVLPWSQHSKWTEAVSLMSLRNDCSPTEPLCARAEFGSCPTRKLSDTTRHAPVDNYGSVPSLVPNATQCRTRDKVTALTLESSFFSFKCRSTFVCPGNRTVYRRADTPKTERRKGRRLTERFMIQGR